MIAKLRQHRTSPKKVNLVASLIRNKPVNEALDILNFTNKKSAPVMKKLLESAVANAVNNFKQSENALYIKEVLVCEGMTYKRSVPISRGRVHPILKRSSHITITLEAKEETEPKAKKTTKKNIDKGVPVDEATELKTNIVEEVKSEEAEKPAKKATTKKSSKTTK